MSSLLTRQPFKFIYTAFILSTLPLRLLSIFIYFIPRSLRQRLTWTYHQAVGTRVFALWWDYATAVEHHTAKSLAPGAEKDRAFVLGGARPLEGGWGPELLSHRMACPVLTPQYCLAVEDHASFPATLQDAITAYAHVVHVLGVSTEHVVLSGDSAGGNLALALLRYLHEDARPALALPRAALLWSPWLDLAGGAARAGLRLRAAGGVRRAACGGTRRRGWTCRTRTSVRWEASSAARCPCWCTRARRR
jgi:hypothetical protein